MIGSFSFLLVIWALAESPGQFPKVQSRECGEICELRTLLPSKVPPAQCRLPFNPLESYFHYLDCTIKQVRPAGVDVVEDDSTMDALLQNAFERCSGLREAGDADLTKKIRSAHSFGGNDYPVEQAVRLVRSIAVLTALGDHYKQSGAENAFAKYVLGVVPQLRPKSEANASN